MLRDMPTAPPNIRELRLRRGWSQEDLAQQCIAKGAQVTREAISSIELHGRVPRPKLRLALAELLNFDVTDFEKAS
jgi:transcriptional regulator with XRE-family HTH domain